MRTILKLLCVLAFVATPLHAQINAGNALSLDGVDDLIIMSNPAGLSPSVITYEAWYKDFGGRLGGHPPVIKSHSYTFEIDPANVMNMYLNINGTWRLIGSIATPINQWHHVAGTYDGTTARFYFDGALVNSTNAFPGTINPAGAVHIGHDPLNTRLFQGLIDEVRIWDHARAEVDLLNDKDYTLTGLESGLLAYYTFDGLDSNGVALDQSGNGHTGAMTNGAVLASSDAPINAGGDSQYCEAQPAGLVGWWKGEGDVSDTIGGINGTFQGGSGYVGGKVGEGFLFDGTRWVQIPSNPNQDPAQITLGGWIKPTFAGRPAQGSDADIITSKIGGGGGYALTAIMDPTATFSQAPGPLPLATPVFYLALSNGSHQIFGSYPMPDDGNYHYVAATYDGATMYLYLDGVEVANRVTAGTLVPATGTDFFIGRVNSTDSRLSRASIDEVTLFDRALSAAEIQSIYAAGTAGICLLVDPYIVTNTNDSGPGSLRQALLNANTDAGTQTITFNIPGAGPHIIAPLAALPNITDPVVIDGTSQPGYSGTPLIELVGGSVAYHGFNLAADNSTIRGFAIHGFNNGILLNGHSGNTIEACHLGLDAAGTTAPGNAAGVRASSSQNNIIGGTTAAARNIISGNVRGVYLTGAATTGNQIQGNYIGTDITGTIDLGNTNSGVFIYNNASGNTIGGSVAGVRNVISGNDIYGLHVNVSGNTVQGNFIGLDASGAADLGNTSTGLFIENAANNIIGGDSVIKRNYISGNDRHGIEIRGATSTGNIVQGNWVGSDVTGFIAVPNGDAVPSKAGLWIEDAPGNIIGGTGFLQGNLFSGNAQDGVFINGSGASGNILQGNFVGTTHTGEGALPNGMRGILISNAPNNIIGGTAPGARNLISGNTAQGLRLSGALTTGTLVQGNWIGINILGNAAIGNGVGVGLISDADGNTIGGTAPNEGNVISGNTTGIAALAGHNTLIYGNLIGTDPAGTGPLGNIDNGVEIETAATNTILGGTAAGQANIIAYNGNNGVQLDPNTGNGHVISGNSIHSNTLFGIDINDDGVTANDPDDADTGPNGVQNYPVLSGAFTGSIRLVGSIDSTPSTTFTLEFFANGACDASGYGEGESYLGSGNVTTDTNGDGSFNITLANNVPIGDFVTATATDPSGNTSEFSQCIQVVEGGIDVSIPDVQSSYATTVQISVQVTDTSGKGIVAAEVFVYYDGDLITAFSAGLTGTLAENGWSIQTNIVQGNSTNIDTIKIAMATDNDVLVGAGDLVNLSFQVADIRVPSSTPLTLSHVLFNDGAPTNTTTDGSLTIIGADGTITSLLATIIPRETVTVTVVDIDLDADGASNTDNVVVTVVNTNNTDSINLTLNEGAIAGTFTGTYDTEYGATANADALIQAKAGDAIVSTYADALDAAGNGPTNRTATTNVIGGADGSVEITIVSQPGDPLYIQVTDSDLNTSVSSAQTASVTVENTTSNDIFIVVLNEADDNDEVFFGSLPTTAGASTGTELGTIEDDIVTVTYDDVVTLVGDQQDRTDNNDVIFPWGDADDNDVLQAFDAAKILVHVLNGSPIDEQASNVDDETITSSINPFDASLVLQKRVGLIATFPVQDPTSENHPQGTASPKLMPDQRSLSLVMGEGYLSVHADDRSRLLAGDLILKGIRGRVEMGAELENYLSASKTTDDGLRIVFAGAEAATGPGELFRVYGSAPTSVELSNAVFNNGGITGTASGLTSMATPDAFALHPNVPNPFNPETTIRFELPQAAIVKLEVFDILGQKVRTLVSGSLQAGTHSAVWHGRNDAGVQVGNGVYLYRIETDGFTQMRRMLLLK